MEIKRKKFKSRVELDDYFDSFGKLFACPFLHAGGGFWIAKFDEPCENCKNKTCSFYGKPFKYPKRLMILVIEREEDGK